MRVEQVEEAIMIPSSNPGGTSHIELKYRLPAVSERPDLMLSADAVDHALFYNKW